MVNDHTQPSFFFSPHPIFFLFFFSLRILLFLSSPLPPSRPSSSSSLFFLVFFILEERPQPPGTQVYPFVSILAFPSPSPSPLPSFLPSSPRPFSFPPKQSNQSPPLPKTPRRVQPIPLANHHHLYHPPTHPHAAQHLSCLLV